MRYGDDLFGAWQRHARRTDFQGSRFSRCRGELKSGVVVADPVWRTRWTCRVAVDVCATAASLSAVIGLSQNRKALFGFVPWMFASLTAFRVLGIAARLRAIVIAVSLRSGLRGSRGRDPHREHGGTSYGAFRPWCANCRRSRPV